MAYNTKSIVKDVNQKPVPQYYNPISDAYEVLQGTNGANKVTLYTASGQAVDLSALIATIVTAINNTGTTQLRTGTNNIGKVDVSNSALPTGAATAAKQDINKTAIDALNTLLTSMKNTDGIKKIVDALPAGTNNIGKIDVANSVLPTGASTSAKQNEIISAIVDLGILLGNVGNAITNNQDETTTHYLNSSDTKPTSNNKKGDKCFVIDADEVSMWNGSAWVVI